VRSVKQYGFNGLSGCVTQFKSRATGTLVGVYHGEQSGLDANPEMPWLTVCEKHHTCVCHETLVSAKRTRDPAEFCEDCRDSQEADSKPAAS
jgi:hypothetical protein